jgi:hypothetical protein
MEYAKQRSVGVIMKFYTSCIYNVVEYEAIKWQQVERTFLQCAQNCSHHIGILHGLTSDYKFTGKSIFYRCKLKFQIFISVV